MLLEISITLLSTAFQCGTGEPEVQFDVNINGIPIAVKETIELEIEVGEDKTLDEKDLKKIISYEATKNLGNCSLLTNETNKTKLLGQNDPIPAYLGFDQQSSVQEIIEKNATEDYLKVYLFELGTTNTGNDAYDLQDLVFQVNTNPSKSEEVAD